MRHRSQKCQLHLGTSLTLLKCTLLTLKPFTAILLFNSHPTISRGDRYRSSYVSRPRQLEVLFYLKVVLVLLTCVLFSVDRSSAPKGLGSTRRDLGSTSARVAEGPHV